MTSASDRSPDGGFVPAELCARVEAAEAALLADIVAGTRARRPDADAFCEAVAGGCAGYAGPGAPVNKIAGLGFAGAPDAGRLAAIEALYHARSAPVVAEVASYADPEVLAALGARGYRLQAFEDVVGRRLDERVVDAGAVEGVALEVVEGDAREAWFDALVDGFAAPDTQGVASTEEFPRDVLREVMRDMATVPGYQTWLARVGGEVAGGGALRVGPGGVAHLCGAATLPAFRRRGVQTALVGARLAAAARAGCEVAVTVTQPGSKSQQNMCRHGFARMCVRAALVLPPDAAERRQPSRSE